MPDQPNNPATPPCRIGASAADLQREADRAVLYGALLAAQRPGVRIKPQIAAAVAELLPAVRAFLQGQAGADAEYASAYARACGAEDILLQKRAAFQQARPSSQGLHE